MAVGARLLLLSLYVGTNFTGSPPHACTTCNPICQPGSEIEYTQSIIAYHLETDRRCQCLEIFQSESKR